jgi:hypothetical protein
MQCMDIQTYACVFEDKASFFTCKGIVGVDLDVMLGRASDMAYEANVHIYFVDTGFMSPAMFDFMMAGTRGVIEKKDMTDEDIKTTVKAWADLHAVTSHLGLKQPPHHYPSFAVYDSYILYILQTKKCYVIKNSIIPRCMWIAVSAISGLTYETRDVLAIESIARDIFDQKTFDTIEELDSKLDMAKNYVDIRASLGFRAQPLAKQSSPPSLVTNKETQTNAQGKADDNNADKKTVPTNSIQSNKRENENENENEKKKKKKTTTCANIIHAPVIPLTNEASAKSPFVKEKAQILRCLHEKFRVLKFGNQETTHRIRAQDLLKVFEAEMNIGKDQILSFRNRLSGYLMEFGLKRKRFSEGYCYYSLQRRNAENKHEIPGASGLAIKTLEEYVKLRSNDDVNGERDQYYDNCVTGFSIQCGYQNWDVNTAHDVVSDCPISVFESIGHVQSSGEALKIPLVCRK